jgi:hypothetical protein
MCWADDCRALVDGTKHDEVEGIMFVIESKEQEDVLLLYGGANYEVVRCEMEAEEVVDGLTFRFCGRLQDVIPTA